MLSILMKMQARERAEKKAEPVVAVEEVQGEVTRPVFSEKPWQDIQEALKQDLSYVRTLAGSKEKDPFKEELINKYRPTVETLLETHKGSYGNLDVLWWWFTWHIDLGKLETIHDDFRAAIDGGLETPSTWKSNSHTAFCDYVFKYTHAASKENKEFNPSFLTQAVKALLAGELATNAPLKVKMFRLVGDWCLEAGDKKKAYNLFEIVMKLDPNKGGRKTKLNDLKEELGYE